MGVPNGYDQVRWTRLEDYGVPLVAGPLVRKPDEVKRGVVGERYE